VASLTARPAGSPARRCTSSLLWGLQRRVLCAATRGRGAGERGMSCAGEGSRHRCLKVAQRRRHRRRPSRAAVVSRPSRRRRCPSRTARRRGSSSGAPGMWRSSRVGELEAGPPCRGSLGRACPRSSRPPRGRGTLRHSIGLPGRRDPSIGDGAAVIYTRIHGWELDLRRLAPAQIHGGGKLGREGRRESPAPPPRRRRPCRSADGGSRAAAASVLVRRGAARGGEGASSPGALLPAWRKMGEEGGGRWGKERGRVKEDDTWGP
jgi:hypothetical protein